MFALLKEDMTLCQGSIISQVLHRIVIENC